MQELDTTPNYIKDPTYLKVFSTVPKTHYSFFWDVIAASHAYELPPSTIAYLITVMRDMHYQCRHYAEEFSGRFGFLENSYQDLVELFIPTYLIDEKKKTDVYVWGTKVVWEMEDYPKTYTPFINSVGVRLVETLKERVYDNTAEINQSR